MGSPTTKHWCGSAVAAQRGAVPAGAAAEAAVAALYPAQLPRESGRGGRVTRGGLLGGERMPFKRSKAA